MLQLYQFTHETSVPECSITSAFCMKFEQRHVSATPEDYYNPSIWIVIWSRCISATGDVSPLLNFTTIY